MNPIQLLFFVATAQCRRVFAAAFLSPVALTGLLLALVAALYAGAGEGGEGGGITEDYIAFYGISANDKNKDLENDGLTCLEENSLWTDPNAADTDRDQLSDLTESGSAEYAISRAWTPLGKGQFIYNGDEMVYARPDWALLVVKDAYGIWWTNTAGRTAWHVPASVSNEAGLLQFRIDRTIITNDLRLALTFQDTGGELVVGLADINGAVLESNLFGNLMSGTGQEKTASWSLPLAAVPAAAVIQLWGGDVTVYDSQLYTDFDGDALDDKAEEMYGTTDSDSDFDDDGLTDGSEVLNYKTNPKNADSDGDGIGDAEEIRVGMNPLVDDRWADLDGDGVNNITEYLMGRSVNVAGAVGDTNAQVRLTLFLPLDQREP